MPVLDQVEDYIKNVTKAWRTNFNNTKYPEELKNLYTAGFEDELAKVERLEYIASQGGTVTNEDNYFKEHRQL